MKLDILAVGAHPDDVELACGGTVAKSVRQGYAVGIVDVTAGELGTRGTTAVRASEAREAGRILGVKIRENLHLPDGNIEINQASLRKFITVIRKYRPTTLLIPYSIERHPDHVRVHHLSREAWFYAGLRKIRTTLGGKPQDAWRPRNYFQYMQWHEFSPTFIVDISDVYGMRIKAIRAHRSQFFNPASSEPETLLSQEAFFTFLETRAKSYGDRIGVPYGEAFYASEAIGITDLLSLKLFGG
jgi:bacillithiol biosynthesis deacetylase BshB1